MDPLAVSHRHPGEERLHCSIQSVAFFSCDCCLALSPTEMELILVGPGCLSSRDVGLTPLVMHLHH